MSSRRSVLELCLRKELVSRLSWQGVRPRAAHFLYSSLPKKFLCNPRCVNIKPDLCRQFVLEVFQGQAAVQRVGPLPFSGLTRVSPLSAELGVGPEHYRV